ncbi:adenosylcobinamide-GDP ribazoletransferase [Nocardioides donggukensis]|uniref:adenosylcobinamide-GDP ribazoletransferase n=1 Tax=Nocardioides donggukensis TaxID=2774019 RepID=UPI00191DD08A|nr:adenosylcobinamide-GDP ribazoletransferase [Nocardioides donggukensis]
MNAVRLALGTLTAVPVAAPASVDRRTAGRAMLLAPVVGLVLGLPLAVAAVLLDDLLAPPVLAALVVSALALLTRGLHLDGLADTADGLGSGRSGAEALAVMRRSDIGPFGVVTLVLVLLLQVTALAACLARGDGALVLLLALVVSRGLLPLAAVPALPAARADGLGATVAGTVSRRSAVLVALGLALLVIATALVDGRQGMTLVLLAVVPALALALRCRTRFGGVTGDVYGAVVETGFTAALVIASGA